MSWFHKTKKLTPEKIANMSMDEIMEIDKNKIPSDDYNVLAVILGRLFIHMTSERIKCLNSLRESLQESLNA